MSQIKEKQINQWHGQLSELRGPFHKPERRPPTRHAERADCCRIGDHRSTPRFMGRTSARFAQILAAALMLWMVAGHCAKAGTYSNAFNSSPTTGARLYQDARVESGVLKLATTTNQVGSLVIDDLDSGRLVSSFTAKFKVRLDAGNGGEGFSFNFAPDLPDAAFGEDGAGSGLSVVFDTAGTDSPSIGIRFRGAVLASSRIALPAGTNLTDVAINVQAIGKVDVVFGTTVVHTNVFGYVPIVGRIGLGARTSEGTAEHWVDDISIATTTLTKPFVASVAPIGPNAGADATVNIRLEDYQTEVNTNSIQLSLNGQIAARSVSKSGSVTTILYNPPGLLASGSTNRLKLIFADRATPPAQTTNEYEFVVEDYATVPSSSTVPRSSIILTNIGFRVRTVQARANAGLETSVARAEAQLAGTLIDPSIGTPYINEAKPGPNADGTFDEPETINYEQEGSPVGNFTEGERGVPGIPGRGAHNNDFAMEALTYLELQAGYQRLGVTSDEGFKVTLGRDIRDAFAPAIGLFDGGRRSGDTIFSFVAETNGFYPCRLVWFEGGGAANVEFYSVTSDGKKILINDRSNTNAIKAYLPTDALSQTPPYVQSVSPRPDSTGVSRKPLVSVVLKDAQSRVATNSVQLRLNGERVTPIITKTGDATLVNFQIPTLLEPLSLNALSLSYADNATPANTVTRQWTFTTARVAKPTGHWDFDAGNLQSTLGANMEYGDGPTGVIASLTEFGTTTSFGISDIAGKPAKIMKYGRPPAPEPLNPGYLIKHGVQPNGGGARVNQWTLVMDIFFPEPQEGGFSSLIETEDTASGGDMFVRWNSIAGPGTGGLGVAGQYTGDGRTQMKVGQWHRVALAVDLTASPPVIGKFIDGVKFQDQGLTAPQVDGRFALSTALRLFADDDNEVNTFYLNSVQILDGKLTDDEIAALGGPAADGVPLPIQSPRLSISQTGNALTISWPANSTASLESADNLLNPVWTRVTGVANNTVTVSINRPSQFYRLR
jgi:hypothetical protein